MGDPDNPANHEDAAALADITAPITDPDINDDRDGTRVYEGDSVHQCDDAGRVLRTGRVTLVRDGACVVHWTAPGIISIERMDCADVVVVEGP